MAPLRPHQRVGSLNCIRSKKLFCTCAPKRFFGRIQNQKNIGHSIPPPHLVRKSYNSHQFLLYWFALIQQALKFLSTYIFPWFCSLAGQHRSSTYFVVITKHQGAEWLAILTLGCTTSFNCGYFFIIVIATRVSDY